jgi:hypothetical protein
MCVERRLRAEDGQHRAGGGAGQLPATLVDERHALGGRRHTGSGRGHGGCGGAGGVGGSRGNAGVGGGAVLDDEVVKDINDHLDKTKVAKAFDAYALNPANKEHLEQLRAEIDAIYPEGTKCPFGKPAQVKNAWFKWAENNEDIKKKYAKIASDFNHKNKSSRPERKKRKRKSKKDKKEAKKTTKKSSSSSEDSEESD